MIMAFNRADALQGACRFRLGFIADLGGQFWVSSLSGFCSGFAAILRIKFSILMPSSSMCAPLRFAVNNRMIDIYYMIIFGIVGIFQKLDYLWRRWCCPSLVTCRVSARQALIMVTQSLISSDLRLPAVDVFALFLFLWRRSRNGGAKPLPRRQALR